ncbi:hypothetical protein C8Q75DRAFT_811625 [Abortiporus biennis]|nr:hypothetical protein C8Q75DRAFT_811625 [Abortiporus biennis]
MFINFTKVTLALLITSLSSSYVTAVPLLNSRSLNSHLFIRSTDSESDHHQIPTQHLIPRGRTNRPLLHPQSIPPPPPPPQAPLANNPRRIVPLSRQDTIASTTSTLVDSSPASSKKSKDAQAMNQRLLLGAQAQTQDTAASNNRLQRQNTFDSTTSTLVEPKKQRNMFGLSKGESKSIDEEKPKSSGGSAGNVGSSTAKGKTPAKPGKVLWSGGPRSGRPVDGSRY